MKINEIITETISEGRVYGWIDPHGQEFQTDDSNDRAHHNLVLDDLKRRGIPGTEHWTNSEDQEDNENVDYDIVSQAIADGWIRIGAIDHELVFAQFSPKIKSRPLSYLLHIIKKFRPRQITLDLMNDEGQRYESADFKSPRKAIAWIRRETGI